MPEVVGAQHVHSCYSDGSGTYREITAAARRAGLDFLVMTDHDTLRPRADGWQGWRDGVLVIVGTEISCKRHCHVVALEARDVGGLRWKPLRRVLFDLANQGSAAFVAHAQPARIWGMPLKAGELHEWEIPGFTGVELWSFMHDICDGLMPWQIPSFLYTWRSRIRGPHPRTLAHWDRITQDRRFAATSSLDNHAIAVPVIGTRILPYETGFRTLRSHVFCEDLAGDPGDAARVVRALSEGAGFLALDLLADARGFRFTGEADGRVLTMGEEARWRGPVALRVRSPVAAKLTLRRNGTKVAEAQGTELERQAEAPGVYRVEAHLDGRPWVFTNPIYLRPPCSREHLSLQGPPDWKPKEELDAGGADF
ncbi:MAG TPA: CehA/McbA family metallohydrolase [Phycisphaerae bacterium]|nr:CehA/McbA family metallohydrolase [Phycisphaerae bacterium]